jgi:D-alanyl-D-alanine carboxypeptidase/D-alanyl-D-alanine-endopeptidase (penicillin-binding protein 4)
MSRLKFHLLSITVATLLSTLALAKSEMNSMCYLEDKEGAVVEGSNAQKMYEIASVSKIVTSFWAINSLGPDFRFTTRLFVDAAGNGAYDVHIAGSEDPYFGREMTHFLFSELQRNGITKIRNLTFDESFSLFWSVREKPTWSIDPSARDIETVLKQKLRLKSAEYTVTRLQAQKQGMKLEPSLKTSITSVKFKSKNDFNPTATTRSFELKSAPLHAYLKEMNRNSNNHVADHLFQIMGGPAEFQKFIKARLNLDPDDINLNNGSGDRIFVKDEKNKSQKVYNEASCEALVNIISAIRVDLKKSNYDIQHIMAVSGVDPQTTLGGRYSSKQMAGAVVAKTGSVDPAITLAGMITTEQGNVYFGILYKTRSASDWPSARNQIRNNVMGLMNKFGGKNAIDDYSSAAFLPFDDKSAIGEMTLKNP